MSTNRPDGLGIGEDPHYIAANEIQTIAWRQYCDIGDEIRELVKEFPDLQKFVF